MVLGGLFAIAFVGLHRLRMPVTWGWVLTNAVVIVAGSEMLYAGSRLIDPSIPIHIEVLLPAFVIGCLARPREVDREANAQAVEHALHATLDRDEEKRAAAVVSAAFMLLVGS